MAAYEGLDRFAGRASLITWLCRIALFRWRASRRTVRIEWVPIVEEQDAPVADFADSRVERLALDGAIYALSPDLLEAFLLVKGEGLTCREAAGTLGIPEGTLKYRVYRACRLLRKSLAPGAEECLPDRQNMDGGVR